MTRFRFSLLSLVVATTVIAAGCAALVYSSPVVSKIVWGVTLLGLTFALLCAILTDSRRRGFWVGFALFGWLYTLIAYGPLSGLGNITSLDPLLNRAAEAMPQVKQPQDATISIDPSESYLRAAEELLLNRLNAIETPGRINLNVQARPVLDAGFVASFVLISHAFVALLLGLVGGVSGHFIRRRSLLSTT